ncbi:hypothetical protein ACIF9R_00620 [Streptomyces sp. NPDC086080]|uniref:hypothetical protein n=1 Tax=Streptomyces sp. NPDC086080 TaxID=3365748 RepID=UPI0037D0A791
MPNEARTAASRSLAGRPFSTAHSPTACHRPAGLAAQVTRQEAAGRLADQDDTWRDAARALAARLDKAHAAE